MREIKFRGKRVDNGEWVYGYYVKDPKGLPRIYWQPFQDATSNTYHFVKSETIGQYTGLNDNNGKEIYEGDMVQTVSRDGVRLSKFQIVWSNDGCKFLKHREDGFYFGLDTSQSLLEIIGNIHETITTPLT